MSSDNNKKTEQQRLNTLNQAIGDMQQLHEGNEKMLRIRTSSSSPTLFNSDAARLNTDKVREALNTMTELRAQLENEMKLDVNNTADDNDNIFTKKSP